MAVYNLLEATCCDYEDYLVGKDENSVEESAHFLNKIKMELDKEPKEHESELVDSWWYFYHFSPLRRSAITWYPFDKESRLLEMGAECGALTGFFCEKCKDIVSIERNSNKAEILYKRYENYNNLNVICCDYQNIFSLYKPQQKFDYVFINRVFQYFDVVDINVLSDFIRNVKDNFLKRGGKIILLADNRYGIRNFCGARDVITGKPYDGINKYPDKKSIFTFSRQEIVQSLLQAGVSNYKFYYPVPDYRVAQVIYSDEYMNKSDLRNRVIFYEPNPETLLALEGNLYEDILDNKALPFLANSFFIECGIDINLCNIDFACCSEDRGKKCGMVTTIHEYKEVIKRPLYQDGYKVLKASLDNLNELSARGIKVVPNRDLGDAISMPFIKAELLTSYLVKVVKTDILHFWQMLDVWYQDILLSSDEVLNMCDARFENIPSAQRGIILKKAYIDMVPLNCFVEDNKLRYFDQEFTLDNVPAKFIIFRGIKYLYQTHKGIQKYVKLEDVKERFALSDCWNELQVAEDNFIHEIRNIKEYGAFYNWTKYNRKEIYQRSHLLDYSGESVLEYTILPSVKVQQRVQLKALEYLDWICTAHNISYFAFYGSLLGAVRHQGFIPWDDDMDIVMMREDYDRFVQLADTIIKEPYFLQTFENDSEAFYGGYAKLRDSSTTGMEPRDWKHSSNQGIWIDIFPLDLCSEVEKDNRKIRGEIEKYQKIIFSLVYDKPIAGFKDSEEEWLERRKTAQRQSYDYWIEQFANALNICKMLDSQYVTVQARYYDRILPKVFWREDFRESIRMKFEGMDIPVPIGYQRCLEIMNGERFMLYPKPQYRKPHHKGLFSDKIPYKTYLSRFEIDFRYSSAILLGEREVINYFIKKYLKKFKLIGILSELVDCVEAITTNIQVSIGCLNEMPEVQLIICAKRFRQYEERLEMLGIRDYKIYITNPQFLVNM